ncbi:NADP-dependent oxidoreductase [Micromonospora thermarum]|uniref:NADP-dependent oxidoreductase n=1 Tax=Micromonospora thermarum TaxID=2720024 RepID=A0ABX0Z8X9_9ACTN|nr:NADP-dependent oxidoreductase [Micromonospora thermarum]NJP32869.1 NADP-dependent oxidoreductase [Micromonospora thermarum]
MKAVRFHQHGDAGALRVEDIERPEPSTGQVLIKVVSTSFNPVDATIRAGYLQQVFPVALPHIPGIDVAGTVEAVGEGVTRFELGDQVVGFLPMTADGAAAEYVLAPVEVLAAAPVAVPLADAAALPATGLTAWQALFEHADVQPGQRILVHGAGGAVGGYAVQLGAQAGATVVATAGPRNAERVRGYGAEVSGRDIGDVTGPFHAVLNFAPVPPADMRALTDLVRAGGVLVTTTTPGPDDEPRGVRSRSVFVRPDAEQLAALVNRVDAGKLHIHVADRVRLDELPAIHARSDAATLTGKTVITL